MGNSAFRKTVRASVLSLTLCCIGLAGTMFSTEPVEKPVKGPSIQNVGTDRATLTWVTQRSTVELTRQAVRDEPLALQAPVYHQMDLTGLKPATRYRFNLSKEGINAEVSFTTAPKGEPSFSFIVWGDTRTRHDVHTRAVARILRENPSLVIHVGDLVANGNNPEDWDKFFEIEKDLLRNVPFYPVLGNHERNTPLFSKYFAFPEGNPHHYSFDWGAAHIVALDTNEVGPTDAMKSAFLQYELEWLKDDLQRNEKPLTFVIFHHPLYTAVKGRRSAAAKLASKIEPILLAGGVTAVFSGHDHNYQHHLKSGLHYVVTGGGGAPLYDVDPIPGVTVKAVKTENYVRVRVQGTKARVEALDLEGNLLETFGLNPRPMRRPDSPRETGH